MNPDDEVYDIEKLIIKDEEKEKKPKKKKMSQIFEIKKK